MVWNGNCHLIERSRLKKCIKNGNVVGFTLNNGCKTREIEINDNFIYLEELPSCNKASHFINFGGVVYLPNMCSYIFCYSTVNLSFMDFSIQNVINDKDGQPLSINPFVEPRRILPYTYIVYANHDFKNGRYNGDMCLLRINATSSIKLPIESNIRNYFKDTALKVFDIKFISSDDNMYKLVISLGDKNGYTPSDTIYFDLRIISDDKVLDYEISNIFTYRGDRYSLVQNKPGNQSYLGEEFFKMFIKSNFMYNLVIQDTEHKRRLREIVK